MKMLRIALYLTILGSVPALAQAQADFPNRPITLFVGMPAGGTADISSRLIARLAEKYLGQPVVIVNKMGGSGTVGTAAFTTAKPDGYTIGYLGTSSIMTVPHIAKLPYHPVKDIEPIIQYSVHNFAVSVRADSPLKTFKDAVDYARKNPGVVTFGTAGANSAQHILMEQIGHLENIEWVHIPFKGGPEALAAVMGGHATMAAGDLNPSLVKANKLRLLVMFLEERWSEFPDVPTLRDLKYPVPVPYIMGIGAPKGVPEPIMKKLEEAFTKAYYDPEFSSGMKTAYLTVFYRNRKDFGDYIAKTFDQIGRFIQEMKKK
jgi:tripartite-type tricarboxylate transporter receptor subunit TctC